MSNKVFSFLAGTVPLNPLYPTGRFSHALADENGQICRSSIAGTEIVPGFDGMVIPVGVTAPQP